MKRIFYQFLLFLFLALSLSGCTIPDSETSTTVSNHLTLHVLDVKEGSATLIESDGHYMLMDGGDREYSSYVVAYLKEQGISSLDYVIASHYDADHLSGLVGALHAFDVGMIFAPDYETDTKIYQSFWATVKDSGYSVVYPNPNDSYRIGDVSFSFVGPMYYGHAEVNDDSLAIRIEDGQNHILICGDATTLSENELASSGITLSSDVLFVNHHGSDTSTSDEFLDAVNPSYAVISSSTEDNSYGHPRKSVLERLKSRDIKLFRTDKQGELLIFSDGKQLTFSKDPCNDYTSLEEESNQSALSPSHYILNTSSLKFHTPDCRTISGMSNENRKDYTGDHKDLLASGYEPCKICNP